MITKKRLAITLVILAFIIVVAVRGAGIGGSTRHTGENATMNSRTPTPTSSSTPALVSKRTPTPTIIGAVDQPDPGSAYVPAGYHLVFNDEFDGSSLDTHKWNTLAPWGVQWYADSNQKQAFVVSAVAVHNGIAQFTAQPSHGHPDANGQPYTSGGITTNGAFTYGYFEARVKVPIGQGLWPALWLTSSTRWPPEWDIFEIIDGIDYGYPHPLSGGRCSWVEGAAGGDDMYKLPDLYGVYHIYGFLWTPSDIYWYVDGVLTEHYAINAAAGADDSFWWNVSLQVGGSWPGDPDGTTPFPAYMDVDYMRLYQK
jgi:beta-glucanase (GH16 family)